MSLNSWFNSLKTSSRRRNRKSSGHSTRLKKQRRMSVEPLEQRMLLTVNLIQNGSFEAVSSGIGGDVPGWQNGPGSLTGGAVTSNYVRLNRRSGEVVR